MSCQKAPTREVKSYRVFVRSLLNSKKPGRPENDLSEDEVEWFCQFIERPDITDTNLGGKKINDTLVNRMGKTSLFLFVTC